MWMNGPGQHTTASIGAPEGDITVLEKIDTTLYNGTVNNWQQAMTNHWLECSSLLGQLRVKLLLTKDSTLPRDDDRRGDVTSILGRASLELVKPVNPSNPAFPVCKSGNGSTWRKCALGLALIGELSDVEMLQSVILDVSDLQKLIFYYIKIKSS